MLHRLIKQWKLDIGFIERGRWLNEFDQSRVFGGGCPCIIGGSLVGTKGCPPTSHAVT